MNTKLTTLVFVVMVFVSIAASPSTEKRTIVLPTAKEISKPSYAGFSVFRIHRQGKGVTSVWNMSSEAGISGFEIQRTYADPSDPYGWEPIWTGPCNSSRSYKWTEEPVYAGLISYRIRAVASSGNENDDVYSETLTIHINGH